MIDLPQTKEMIIHVPQAMKRYFYELVAGSACIAISTVIALTMMYQVLDSDKPEWVRLVYFLVIALALVLLIVGFRIVLDSESERKLATQYDKHEWMMSRQYLSISLALLEGKERATLRKFKTGAVQLEWDDIVKIVLTEEQKAPKAQPAFIEIHVQNHEMTLGENAVLYVRRDLLAAQEKTIMDFCRSHGVKVEIETAAAATPSSQSAG